MIIKAITYRSDETNLFKDLYLNLFKSVGSECINKKIQSSEFPCSGNGTSQVPQPLKDLVHLVVRVFYEEKHVVLMDMLTEEPM